MSQSKNIQLVNAHTFELDPNKRYLLVFEEGTMSREHCSIALRRLKQIGITSLGLAVKDVHGIQIIEDTREEDKS